MQFVKGSFYPIENASLKVASYSQVYSCYLVRLCYCGVELQERKLVVIFVPLHKELSLSSDVFDKKKYYNF